MTNVITANLSKCRFYRASPVYQYNYGMMLKITGVELPTAYEVDFSNDVGGTSITQIGNADGVTIPSQFFQPGQAIYAWLRVHPTADSSVTTATIVIPISPRATITDEEPTPEEQSAIDEAISALNDAVDKAEEAVEHYPTITGGIWYVWDVDAGEYVSTGIPAQGAQGNPGVDGHDGTDGFSPTATVTQTQTGATISITDKQGTTTANISNGQDGSPGQPGTDGADGVSPTVTVTDITGGHRVTITDAEHPTGQTIDVMNGQDGQPGTDGTDGVGVPAGGTTGQVLSKASGTDYDTEWTTPEAGGVTDVQVNGTSVVSGGVANVPIADNASSLGVVKGYMDRGVVVLSDGRLATRAATSAAIKAGTNVYLPIMPSTQNESAFYGLAKAAGDTSQSLSSNAVGTYTDAAKSAIQTMLGINTDKWELIRDYTPSENVNTISIIADDRNESFTLKKALILCQYQAADTTTNNNEVVVDMRGDKAQFANINNCNSANTNGDCIVEVDCSSGVQLCKASYSTNPIVTTNLVASVVTTVKLVNPSVSTMSSFMIRLGNSSYKFKAETTRIRIYGIRV